MKNTWFVSSGYTVIKTPTAQISLSGVGVAAMQEHKAEMQKDIERLSRRIAAVDSYLNGEAVLSPDALR